MPSLMNSDEEMTSDEEINSNDENETDTGNERSNNDPDQNCEYEFSRMIATKVNDKEIINRMRDISDQHGINDENNELVTRAHVTVAIFKPNEALKSSLLDALKNELKEIISFNMIAKGINEFEKETQIS